MKEFYAVVYFKNKDLIDLDMMPANLNIMANAGHLWRKENFSFPKHLDNADKTFIDSGGYQFMKKFTEYPFNPKEYVDFINEVNPDYFAAMDYPCEPKILERRKKTSEQQIEDTIEKTIDLLDLESHSKLLPVIQGWSIEDYIYCIDRMREQDLLSDYMAIGSLCIRDESIYPIIKAITDNIPSDIKLHGFGVKISNLKNKFVFDNLYSSDSMAWLFPHMFGRVTVFTGSRLAELDTRNKLTDAERGRISLRGYIEYVNYLIKIQASQSTLKEY